MSRYTDRHGIRTRLASAAKEADPVWGPLWHNLTEIENEVNFLDDVIGAMRILENSDSSTPGQRYILIEALEVRHTQLEEALRAAEEAAREAKQLAA